MLFNRGNGVRHLWWKRGQPIGGTEPNSGNTITGNVGDGVVIQGSQSQFNTVQRNAIALNADGVNLSGAQLELIGGTEGGAGNTITMNRGNGISLTAGALGNQVQGNFIGTDASGASGLSNGLDGVNLSETTTDLNTIGGTSIGCSQRDLGKHGERNQSHGRRFEQ